MGGELDQGYKKTWTLNLMFVVFLNQMLLLQTLLRTFTYNEKVKKQPK
jgi:hypothetical protein